MIFLLASSEEYGLIMLLHCRICWFYAHRSLFSICQGPTNLDFHFWSFLADVKFGLYCKDLHLNPKECECLGCNLLFELGTAPQMFGIVQSGSFHSEH